MERQNYQKKYVFYSFLFGSIFSLIFNLLKRFVISKIMVKFYPLYGDVLKFSFWNTVVGASLYVWVDIFIGILFGFVVFLNLKITKKIDYNFNKDKYGATTYVVLGLVVTNILYDLIANHSLAGNTGLFPIILAFALTLFYKKTGFTSR